MAAQRSKCLDCDFRYAVGRSKRCNPCRRKRTRRVKHDGHLRAKYGISIQDYDEMLALQGGRCAICGGGTSKNFFATDHDHRTGEVRGLLCATDNKILGKFKDSASRFRRAAEYLDSPPARKVLKDRDWSRYAG